MPHLSDQVSPKRKSSVAAFTESLLIRKNSLSTLSSVLRHHLSCHHRRPLFLLYFLCLQIVLFVVGCSSSLSFSFHHIRRHLPTATVPVNSSFNEYEQRNSSRVYVYDMPSLFNSELLEQCEDLNPWSLSCNAMTNEGFGWSTTNVDEIVPIDMLMVWFRTDKLVSKIIFYNKILKHKCRNMESGSTASFYIGLPVRKYLWLNYIVVDRDRHCEMMMQWVQGQESYQKSNDWDHFLTMGRITWDFRRSKDSDWGCRCIYLPRMHNIMQFLIERNSWDYFNVGVPYPTRFHPRSVAFS